MAKLPKSYIPGKKMVRVCKVINRANKHGLIDDDKEAHDELVALRRNMTEGETNWPYASEGYRLVPNESVLDHKIIQSRVSALIATFTSLPRTLKEGRATKGAEWVDPLSFLQRDEHEVEAHARNNRENAEKAAETAQAETIAKATGEAEAKHAESIAMIVENLRKTLKGKALKTALEAFGVKE